ncbi:MAG: GEVED domain-containing protein [Bacteroidota bacterium]
MNYNKKFSLVFRSIILLFITFSSFNSFSQIVKTFNTTGNGTWTAPCGVTSITLECWGAGGGGASATGNTSAGGGGSGGGYIKATYTVVPGTTYNLFVGTGGSGNSGQDGTATWFDNNTLVLAVGGRGAGVAISGANSFGNGATAFTTGNIGGTTTSNYGGNGGNAQNLATDVSGGAGASGGSSDNVNKHASGITGGTAQTDGFAGVNGFNSNSAGSVGNIGAGGSGGRTSNNTDRLGGAGGNGQIRISYSGTSYCDVTFSSAIEPITNVTFLGVNNTTSGTVNGTPSHEDFTSLGCTTNDVQQGNTFSLSVSGNTDGNFTDFIRVFLDWNQDGDFNDTGESFDLGSITNCTSCAVITNILVPCNATLGLTKMRVFKDYNAVPTSACSSSNNFGQVEDYVINVTASTGTYVSSTVKQDNTLSVSKGTTNNEVIGIEIVMSGCKNLTSFTVNTTGTTSTADISNAKIWSTGASSVFATSTQFGSTVASPNGSFNITSTLSLPNGTSYLWLTYDVVAGATTNNLIDAQCTSLTVDATPRTPSTTAPTGSRQIGVQKNWVGAGAGGAGTDFNTATNWNPVGVPGPADIIIMNLTANISPTITFSSATTTIGSIAMDVNRAGNTYILDVAGNTFNVNGNATFNISGGNGTTFLRVNVGNGGTINYNGNTTFSASVGNVFGVYGAGGTSGVINCKRNLTFSNARAITQSANLPASVIMDGTGSQTLTSNNGVATIFPLLQIGNVNSPTVTLSQSIASSIQPNTVLINNNSTLILPLSNALNRSAAGGTFTMNTGATLKLAGTTGGQTGSNFPLNYSTMTLNPTSTVEYNGIAGQTIFGGATITYGHLTLTNNATKSATASITTAGNLTINSSSTFAAGTSLTHNIGGNWINNGTFSFTTGNIINFNGNNILQTVSGSSTTGFHTLIVNKGTSITNVLDIISLITLANPTNALTITNGTFKLSSASTLSPFSNNAGATIPSTGGFINNGGTINAGAFSWTNNGLFRNILGTTNIGSAAGNSLSNSSTSNFDMQGGTLNISGRLENTGSTFTQSGGTITLTTNANTSSTVGNFDASATTNINITGGTIIFRNPNTNASPFNSLNIISGAGTKTISGGTFQIGDGTTPVAQTFLVNSPVSLFNFTINNSNTPIVRLVTNDLTISGTLTMNGGNIDGATNTRSVIITNGNNTAISRTAGFINHNLRRTISNSAVSYLFPIGFSTNYTPADLTFTNLTAGDLNILAVTGDESNLVAGSGIDGAVSINSHWILTASGGLASTNYAGTLNYPVGLNDLAAQASNYIVGKNNSGWTYPTVSGTPTSTNTLFTAASGFGNLAIGKCKAAPTSVPGSNQDICGTSTTLAATAVSSPASGTWSIISGTGGSFGDNTSSTSSFSGTAGTTYVLRWTVGYAGTTCSTNANDVSITLNPVPTATAGGSITASVGEYNTVSGTNSTNGTILWTHDGTGYFDTDYFTDDETTLIPTYYTDEGDFGQTVTLTMTVTGTGVCSATSATANYTVNVNGSPAIWTYQCGTTVPSVDEYVYAYSYPGATQYRYRINDGVTSQTIVRTASLFYFREFSIFQYSTTYNVDVSVFVSGAWTAFGPVCQISTPAIPTTQVITSQCGSTLASLNTTIYADQVWSATDYEFQIFDGVTTQNYQTTNRYFNLTNLATYNYSTTYSVQVRVKYNSVWGAYGPSCNITSPASTTKLSTAHCGVTLTNIDTDIVADNVVNATEYRFRLINGGTTLTIDKDSRTFKCSQIAGIQYATTYVVDVATKLNGVWGTFGADCNLTTPLSLQTKLVTSQCGITLTDMNTDIVADLVSGATQYRFRLINGGTTLTIDKDSRTFKCAQVSGIQYSTTYNVSVSSFLNGVWQAYGTVCTLTTPSAGTQIRASQCGTVIANMNDYIYSDEVFGATQYRFRLVNGGTTLTYDSPGRFFACSAITGIQGSTVYNTSVAVFLNGSWGAYGPICTLTTPVIPVTSKIRTTQCGITLASMFTDIYADAVTNATMYRFRLYDGVTYLTIDNSYRSFRCTQFPSIQYGTTYSVDVAVFIGGSWQAFGAVCNVTTQNFPTTQIRATQCNTTLTSIYDWIYADEVFGATQYRFKVSKIGFLDSITSSGRFFRFSQLTGLDIDSVYNVNVQIYYGGQWKTYGDTCTITTPNTLTIPLDEELTELVDETEFENGESNNSILSVSKENKANEFIKIYPNPFIESFNIDLETNSNQAININIIDITGKQVENIILNRDEIQALKLGEYYESGMYYITIRQGDNSQQFKVIKN